SSSAAASVSAVSPSMLSRATDTAPTLTTLRSRSTSPIRTVWVSILTLPGAARATTTASAYRNTGRLAAARSRPIPHSDTLRERRWGHATLDVVEDIPLRPTSLQQYVGQARLK